MTATAKRDHDHDIDMCGQHGQFLSDIGWLKSYTRIILTLVGTSAIALIGIFGTIVSFGMEMKVASQVMQKELARLAGDVVELKAADKKICQDIQTLKSKHPRGISTTTESQSWSE